jgi:hypothetical protein
MTRLAKNLVENFVDCVPGRGPGEGVEQSELIVELCPASVDVAGFVGLDAKHGASRFVWGAVR